jgi:hypothetical protein
VVKFERTRTDRKMPSSTRALIRGVLAVWDSQDETMLRMYAAGCSVEHIAEVTGRSERGISESLEAWHSLGRNPRNGVSR